MNALTSTRISQRQLKVIPIEQIRVLNPRARNQRHFKEIVKSIAQVGLKRPITVSARSSDTDPFKYDLVCRLLLEKKNDQIGQTAIPAMLIGTEETDQLVMSLGANCALRQSHARYLLSA